MSRPHNPITDDRVRKSFAVFIAELRSSALETSTDADRELLVNRSLAAVAGTTGVVLSIQSRHDALAATMLAVAVQLWTRKPKPGGPEAQL